MRSPPATRPGDTIVVWRLGEGGAQGGLVSGAAASSDARLRSLLDDAAPAVKRLGYVRSAEAAIAADKVKPWQAVTDALGTYRTLRDAQVRLLTDVDIVDVNAAAPGALGRSPFALMRHVENGWPQWRTSDFDRRNGIGSLMANRRGRTTRTASTSSCG